MIIFIWLKGHLLFWGQTFFLKSLDFVLENDGWLLGGIDTVGLDGDHEMSSVLKEILGIDSNDSGLIWLGDIGENDINHTDQESVLKGSSGISNNGDNIGSLLGHIYKVSSGSVGELDSIDGSLWSNKIGDVGDSGSTGSSEVENLGTWLDIDLTDTSNDGGSNFTSVWVPDSVLNFFSVGEVLTHSLFIVDTFSWGGVLGK